jgi:hypothetical protein
MQWHDLAEIRGVIISGTIAVAGLLAGRKVGFRGSSGCPDPFKVGYTAFQIWGSPELTYRLFCFGSEFLSPSFLDSPRRPGQRSLLLALP